MSRRELDLEYDENNNVLSDSGGDRSFIERHLELGGQDDFLIIPNGGSGDCMFKAVSQAVYKGDESKHKAIRKKVVDFITRERWEKFSESIEVQHINGNVLLQRHWSKDPKQAYKMYMTLDGTLGSSTELTAAGELFHYNFATIQEYCSSTQRTYRVENCILFEDDSEEGNFHYFYFTGDYDNGHWEYLRNLSNDKIEDGTYSGLHRTLIEGEEITVEDWLQRETDNDNEADRLKVAVNRVHYWRRESPYPFESTLFRYNEDSSVTLNRERFTIADTESTDLFSVLAQECLQNEGAAHEAELVLMKHRYSYFEDLNYKLITQPYSHNFTVEAIRYCAHPCKGNIQDLISAADLYSFSFVLYMKLDKNCAGVHQCKFTHVDRWGGESDRILYFFMKLVESEVADEIDARWWRLIPCPLPEGGIQRGKSRHRLGGGDITLGRTGSRRSSLNLSMVSEKGSRQRPASADRCNKRRDCPPQRSYSRTSTPRAFTERTVSAVSRVSFQDETTFPRFHNPTVQKKIQQTAPPPVQRQDYENEADMEAAECLRRDHDNIFGSFSTPNKLNTNLLGTPGPARASEGVLVKKWHPYPAERIKRATGKDLLEHPEKVKTLVRVCDKNRFGREMTYTGSGVMEASAVLDDLKAKGLIKASPVSKSPTVRPQSQISQFSQEKNASEKLKDEEEKTRPPPRDMFMALEMRHKDYDSLLKLRDENFNQVRNKKKREAKTSDEDESEDSEVSYEPQEQRKTPERSHSTVYVHNEGRTEFKGAVVASNEKLQQQTNVKRGKSKVVPDYPLQPSQSSSMEQFSDICTICVGRLLQLLFCFFGGIARICANAKKAVIAEHERRNPIKQQALPTHMPGHDQWPVPNNIN